jgi:hypothetical protein
MVTPTGLVDPDTGNSVGLGCFLSVRDGRNWMSHGGRNLGYCSTNLVAVDEPIGAVVLTNGYAGGTAVGEATIARLLGLSRPS